MDAAGGAAVIPALPDAGRYECGRAAPKAWHPSFRIHPVSS